MLVVPSHETFVTFSGRVLLLRCNRPKVALPNVKQFRLTDNAKSKGPGKRSLSLAFLARARAVFRELYDRI